MKIKIQNVAAKDIEAESFRIIESEIGETNFSPSEFAVVRRSIHATGDFDFAENMRFTPDAIEAGLRAIKAGKNILVDVNMAVSGVSRWLLSEFGGEVICLVSDPQVAEKAKQQGKTRSDVGIEMAKGMNVGIVAIGNAPTALLKVMELVDKGEFAPDLIVGVPVGFVNAVESKALLAEKKYPHITALGRKGGTPVSVATVNALLRLATV